MLKRRSNKLEPACHFGVVAAVIFSVIMPLSGMTQQSSAVVASKIDESDGAPKKRPQPLTPPGVIAVPEGFEKLTLSPGYLLEMDVYDTPEMSAELRIDVHGDVSVPLIGAVHVEGETLSQAQITISNALIEREILKDPQVTLNILQFSATSISVLGEVQTPGRVQLLAPSSLGEVIALAGGETIAAGNDIEIQHPLDHGELTSRHIEYAQGEDSTKLQSILVEPGDTVFVRRAGVIYVLGAVNRPGGYLMVNGGALSVIQAVSLAGGTTLQASTRWAVIVRRQGNDFIQFKVPLGKMETGDATPVQLQWNDALYVPVSAWKAVLVNGSNVISPATSAAIYRAP